MTEDQSNANLRLSVLDGMGLYNGESAIDALQHSTKAAKLVDELGYTRLWFTEHHNSKHQMSTSPDILSTYAAVTKSIRIGSGEIMLPNHSALRVVENFSLPEGLYPGRIDLGMGRASGIGGITMNR